MKFRAHYKPNPADSPELRCHERKIITNDQGDKKLGTLKMYTQIAAVAKCIERDVINMLQKFSNYILIMPFLYETNVIYFIFFQT